MKKILSLGKKFVPGCTFLLVLIALNAFAPAHNSPIKSNLNTQIDQDDFITGTVSDLGGPIPGVLVQVKGTRISTLTDLNGYYSIMAAPGDTLTFTYSGYETIEVEIGIDSIIDVELYEAVALEEAVINAGYYQVKDRERTGSISRVTAEEIENQPVGNVLAAIQGRIAGVQITQNSGVPGGGYEVAIRGTNSLRWEGNKPLYIIDGVPILANSVSGLSATVFPRLDINPLNSLNINEIESIEFLKDADATSIYGSRGANGVILITTKKGKNGQIAFSLNSSYGFSQLTHKMKMLNTEEYLYVRRQGFENDGIEEFPATAFDINGSWDQSRYTDWQDKLLGHTATHSTIELSLRGGSEKTSFLFSANHNEQQTVFSDNFIYKSNTLNGNLTHIGLEGKLKLNASGIFSTQSNNVLQQDITYKAINLPPNAPALYQEDGSLNWEDNTFDNPVAPFQGPYKYKTYSVLTNLNLEYSLFSFLKLKFNSGINYQNFTEMTLTPHTIYNPAYDISSEFSSIYKFNNEDLSYIIEPQLSFDKKLSYHNLEALIGGTYQSMDKLNTGLYGRGFQSNTLLENIAAANTVEVLNNSETQYRYSAIFGRINYNYKKKYIVNLTGRRDGSSRFGANNKFSNFGAVGVAWIFTNENILRNIEWLNYGKIRSSIGVTGSDQIGDYQYLDTYSLENSYYNNTLTLSPSRLFNPDFSWEKTLKKEVALELSLFHNRLLLNLVWYENRSNNQLVGIPLPGTTGFNSVQANLPATVQNTGWELEFRADPFKKSDIRWETSFNISFPKNKLLSFPKLEGSTFSNQYIIGQPLSIVKLYNYEGIDPNTGLYTFTDFNGDGVISAPEDQQIIRDIGIKYSGGWGNKISYKDLSLSFLFQFVKQNQWNYLNRMPTPGTMNNLPVEILDVWSESNPNGHYMPYSAGQDFEKKELHGLYMESTSAVSDASYIRLKNIQLNYRIKLKSFVNEINIYWQGQNLLTFTKYFGLDPEFSLIGYLPPLKTYSFGVQFNF